MFSLNMDSLGCQPFKGVNWTLVLSLNFEDVIMGLLLVLCPFLIPFWAYVLGLCTYYFKLHQLYTKNIYPSNVEVAVGRAGLGRAQTGPGQNWPDFFRATILTAQPALKTGPVGPNCLFKAKKNSGGLGRAGPYRAGPYRAGPYRAGPYRAGPNLARFFSGQKFNGPARP